MEQRILKESADRDIASIKELNLGNCKSSNVVGLSEDWKNLEQLNLDNVGLTTLKGFPRLPSLKKLELKENNLCEGFDALACLPKLEELNLSGNKIKDVDAFESLSQLTTLKKLNLAGCDVCKVDNYKDKLFKLIPSLVNLDGNPKAKTDSPVKSAVNGKVEEVDDEGDNSLEEEDDDDDSLDNEMDEDDDDDLGEEEDEDEEEEDIPLEALYNKINEEGDDDDFEANEDEDEDSASEEEDDEDEEAINLSRDDAEETEEVRGTKRKHEEEK